MRIYSKILYVNLKNWLSYCGNETYIFTLKQLQRLSLKHLSALPLLTRGILTLTLSPSSNEPVILFLLWSLLRNSAFLICPSESR
jgi:hypothetical protein